MIVPAMILCAAGAFALFIVSLVLNFHMVGLNEQAQQKMLREGWIVTPDQLAWHTSNKKRIAAVQELADLLNRLGFFLLCILVVMLFTYLPHIFPPQ